MYHLSAISLAFFSTNDNDKNRADLIEKIMTLFGHNVSTSLKAVRPYMYYMTSIVLTSNIKLSRSYLF